MECRLLQVVDLPPPPDGSRANVVIGQVVGIHVANEVIVDGIIDVKRINPLARLGYLDYATLDMESVFSLRPPGGDPRFDER
jgi:flavin reductase (DIM6/NTAB) family NADH-FMN oxidoreductase RutF